LYGWRRGWPLPPLATRPGGAVAIASTPPAGPPAELPAAELARRLADGHRLFTLTVDRELAAYGWAATGPAHIGGLDLAFTVPPGERYLWDFATLPRYRGRGLYPLLLQEILRRESDEAEWFWIGHEPGNTASRRGILKAGFRLAGQICRRPSGELALAGAAAEDPELSPRAAHALGLPLLDPRPPASHPSTDAG
jgi:GNAT superfamily N-acetyltransferase